MTNFWHRQNISHHQHMEHSQQWVDQGALRRLLNTKFNAKRFNTVVDVGAMLPTPVTYWNLFKPNRLLCFEPGIQECNKIRKHPSVMNNKNIEVFQVACSDYDGNAFLNLAVNEHAHSLKEFKTSKGTQATEVVRLERVLEQKNVEKIDFLDTDTQGNDYEVLMGCGKYLKTVDIVTVEVWFKKLISSRGQIGGGYTNVATFDKVWSLLGSNGLELHSFPSLMYKHGALEWGDALFYRPPK